MPPQVVAGRAIWLQWCTIAGVTTAVASTKTGLGCTIEMVILCVGGCIQQLVVVVASLQRGAAENLSVVLTLSNICCVG